MLVRSSVEEALAKLETWITAPSGNYRDTLPWLAVIPAKDYELYLQFVSSIAEMESKTLDKEVAHWRRLLDGKQPAPPINTMPSAPANAWGLVPYHAPNAPLAPYRCPYCGSGRPPVPRSHVSGAGWFVFTVLLLTTCVLAPFGFLIRTRYRECPSCRGRLRLR